MPSDTLTNVIFYGPSGTGKTHATIRRAVELCGEEIPGNDHDLRKVYKNLVKYGRIEFVTFHQSMSYEDFVEGRKPVAEVLHRETASPIGFSLEIVPGIFRRLARRATEILGDPRTDSILTIRDEKVYKVSTGTRKENQDDKIFADSINKNRVFLDVIDIDLSDNKYSDYYQIRYAIEKKTGNQGKEYIKAGMLYGFRSARVGDIVVLSKGNTKFRAIGRFHGDYEYSPRPGGGYAHQRKVIWDWHDEDGIDARDLTGKNFISRSFYKIREDTINVNFLEGLINSCKLENYVLIIDEINRANISKVFGELITLLEPDKRLGQPNEMKVRLPYSGDDFGVPQNLHIVGTMNTADRSIAHIDAALRRRFTFHEMMPNAQVLKGRCKVDLSKLLDTINRRIEQLYDREHQIGHAYFIDCRSKHDLDEVMRYKIIPLLAEYFFDDWRKVAIVLGDLDVTSNQERCCFLKRNDIQVPKGLTGVQNVSRISWSVLPKEKAFDYRNLV